MKALFFSDCICAKSPRFPLRVAVAVMLVCATAGRGVAADRSTPSTGSGQAGSDQGAAHSTSPFDKLRVSSDSGPSAFVRVADAPLVFTGQVAAADAEGALQALDVTLKKAGSELGRVVRLHAYVGDDRAVSEVEAAVAKRFGFEHDHEHEHEHEKAGMARRFTAAVTVVRTPLAEVPALPSRATTGREVARVAFEAVAVSSLDVPVVKVVENGAVLPAGGKIFISGQAVRGDDLAGAVKATMAGLHRSVAHLGLKKSDIVQVKAFIKPFSDHAVVGREVAASFEGAPVPPVVAMEWVSDLFAEIEIVVSARGLAMPAGEKITYAWLPWLTKSTRYCHVTHIAAGTPLIFIGAIEGGGAADARGQMKTIFERLGSTLFEAGSSYRHMAKATYYLVHPEARGLLGDIRDVYYDPARPPSASALNMNGLGMPGRAAMIDIVAVPAK